MGYTENNRTGKRGESNVAEFFEYEIGFIHQETKNPDVGLDGKILITEENDRSKLTGASFSVQVKSSAEITAQDFYSVVISDQNMEHYLSSTRPVVIVLVDNATKRMWWHPVDPNEIYVKTEEGYSVRFDLRRDVLSVASSRELRSLAEFTNAVAARDLIANANDILNEYAVKKENIFDNGATISEWVQKLIELEENYKAAKLLLEHEKRDSTLIRSIRSETERLGNDVWSHKRWMLNHWPESEIRAEYPDPLGVV